MLALASTRPRQLAGHALSAVRRRISRWTKPITLLFACIIVERGSRRVLHVEVTRRPTDEWVAQQLREATPYDARPRFLSHENDGKGGSGFAHLAAASGITVPLTPVRPPRADAIVERFLGRVRRECLDHPLIVREAHLRRVLHEYVAYCTGARPHHALDQCVPTPLSRGQLAGRQSAVVALPVLGDLHQDYRSVA